ncbi:VOC family protein [Nonomuraea pusilla]|uniref:Uncharacterized conserved protein PhnB, glyoxalase superfamily n=1 Tax=Nonomuraea pusilla TaxID=46177 RepID=A0A1H8GU55_9ACTN|nr:VOC family protein [Nonomuraea pusilla]SEN47254.1 Uncharacterized conserved protein PhnB, glyoxalase superfamily [Nonomuraea pusilla]
MTRTVYALARYQNVQTALDFLTTAFGFLVHEASTNEQGAVYHAELLVGDDIVMIGEGRAGGPGVYVAVEDVDGHHDRARDAGARITAPLTDQPYGSREYACADPEGNLWYFGTYRP